MLHATEEILVLAHIIFNGLQGFIILTIFTLNERVLRLYKDWFKKMGKKWKKSKVSRHEKEVVASGQGCQI